MGDIANGRSNTHLNPMFLVMNNEGPVVLQTLYDGGVGWITDYDFFIHNMANIFYTVHV